MNKRSFEERRPAAQSLDRVVRMRTYRYFLLLFWVGQPYPTFSTPLSKRTSGFPARRRALELSGNSRHELNRSKRSWMWNQFFLLEEYTGSGNQYVGKVGFQWVLWHCGFKSLKKLLLASRRGGCALVPNTIRTVAYLVRVLFPLESFQVEDCSKKLRYVSTLTKREKCPGGKWNAHNHPHRIITNPLIFTLAGKIWPRLFYEAGCIKNRNREIKP